MQIDDNPDEEREMTYLMVKSQVEDLLRIRAELDDADQEVQIDKLISGYRGIVKKHFKDFLKSGETKG